LGCGCIPKCKHQKSTKENHIPNIYKFQENSRPPPPKKNTPGTEYSSKQQQPVNTILTNFGPGKNITSK
jgi:hypothetical protein